MEKFDSNYEKIQINRLSPNCLIGAIEAISKVKYNIPDFGKLWFGHNYVYKKDSSGIEKKTNSLNLNCVFYRSVIISKADIENRLRYIYGVQTSYKQYYSFQKLLYDIKKATINGDAIISELDMFYLPTRREYHNVHNQHVMIVYGIDEENNSLKICEELVGHFKLPLKDYLEFFNEVTDIINRPFYIMQFDLNGNIKNKIKLSDFEQDFNLSLHNIESNSAELGLKALRTFREDFQKLIDRKEYTFYIPGIWTCTAECANASKYLMNLRKDFEEFSEIKSLEKSQIILKNIGQTWFEIEMNIESALSDNDHRPIRKIIDQLSSIAENEIELLEALKCIRKDFYKISHFEKEI